VVCGGATGAAEKPMGSALPSPPPPQDTRTIAQANALKIERIRQYCFKKQCGPLDDLTLIL